MRSAASPITASSDRATGGQRQLHAFLADLLRDPGETLADQLRRVNRLREDRRCAAPYDLARGERETPGACASERGALVAPASRSPQMAGRPRRTRKYQQRIAVAARRRCCTLRGNRRRSRPWSTNDSCCGSKRLPGRQPRLRQALPGSYIPTSALRRCRHPGRWRERKPLLLSQSSSGNLTAAPRCLARATPAAALG